MKHLLLLTAFIIAMLALFFYAEVAAALVVIGYVLAGALGVAALGGAFFGGWFLLERLRLLRAARLQAEKAAQVQIVSDNGETWIRDSDPQSTWRNLTGTPALYVTPQPQPPQPWEIELHRLKLAAQTRPGPPLGPGQSPLLPPSAWLDLLTVFTQPLQAYAIIGGQQTGKTFQARHLAAYWVRQGHRPVVIGPKWDQGEWGGCYLLGGNGDFTAVERGIRMVRRLVEQRHAAPVPHKSHPLQPVFFDDWTPIVEAVPSARALVLEATTLYASVNVLLYFILHSDTAHAWGVDRKGAALKENFLKLLLQPVYDADGRVDRGQTQGVIRFAGESIERPTRLFTSPPLVSQPPIVLKPGRGHPSPVEARIVALQRAGVSKAEICRDIWGSVGGKQYQLLEAILEKYQPD